MALEKREGIWYIRFTVGGQRIQRSSGTSDRQAAEQLELKLKEEYWRVIKLGDKPQMSWQQAVNRWLDEKKHKKSLDTDMFILRWLDPHLKDMALEQITREKINEIAKAKESEGCTAGRINRVLSLLRSILIKARDDWEWLEKIPKVVLWSDKARRVRWLTRAQARKVMKELPRHLRHMMAFTLATGLRASNVHQLRWEDVDMVKKHCWVHPDKAKGTKAIAVPLNRSALKILKRWVGKNTEWVFVYQNHPVRQCGTKAWRRALKKAGISEFRWHDLRHTWASWHVQNGTPLHELQQLGAWKSYEMVLRYAHLGADHLKAAAERITNRGDKNNDV